MHEHQGPGQAAVVESVAGTHAPTPPRYGWMSALGAVVAGSIVTFLALLLLSLALSPLHVLPESYPGEPGTGWPFHIDGAWSALADLGHLLLASALVAGGASSTSARKRVDAPRAGPWRSAPWSWAGFPLLRAGVRGCSG